MHAPSPGFLASYIKTEWRTIATLSCLDRDCPSQRCRHFKFGSSDCGVNRLDCFSPHRYSHTSPAIVSTKNIDQVHQGSLIAARQCREEVFEEECQSGHGQEEGRPSLVCRGAELLFRVHSYSQALRYSKFKNFKLSSIPLVLVIPGPSLSDSCSLAYCNTVVRTPPSPAIQIRTPTPTPPTYTVCAACLS